MTMGLVAMVAQLACLAAPAPEVGPPVPVCPAPPDARPQLAPACAGDGRGTFLVAWQQGRKYFEGEDPVVLAARVSAEGKLLDDRPLRLCAARGSQDAPRVAFAGGVFLVVWQDFRNGKDWDVYATRVTPEGRVLDAEGLAIAAGAHSQAMPDVAGGPDGFLVAWQHHRDGERYEPRAARVGPNGRVLDPDGVELSLGGERLRGGSVGLVRAADGWLLAWRDDFAWGVGGGPSARTTRLVARLSDAGGQLKVLNVNRAPPGVYGLYPACLASAGDRVFLGTGGSQRSVRCAMGCVLDTATGAALPNPNAETKIGASGWNTAQAIVLLEPLVPGFQPPLGAGSDGAAFLVAVRQRAEERRDPRQPLRLLRLDRDGRKLDAAGALPVLDDGAVPCSCPAVAGGPRGSFLVAYESDGGPGQRRVLARRVRLP
ncbi:MAG TPA: hypothetical protein VNE39_04915 [Planctomycetota bacterium]|nr:hypothetical protein [Planctomycetota bacterium]